MPENILLVEESSEALCVWYKAGVKNMPLVRFSDTLDFHTDLVRIDHDAEQIRAALEGSSCEQLLPRTAYVDSADMLYGSGDFISAAFRLGIVRELWWVAPVDAESLEDFDNFKKWAQGTFHFPRDFMETLKPDNRVINGTYRGMPVHISSLEHLPALDGPVLLNIDTDYFVRLHKNPVKKGMLDLVGEFFQILRKKDLRGDFGVISSSLRDGSTPLRFAYLSDYVRDLLASPDNLAKGPPSAWRAQNTIEYLFFMMARDEALAEAKHFAEMEPGSAVPWYDLASIAAARGNAEDVRRFLQEAVKRDGRYRRGYATLSKVLLEGDLVEESLSLLEEGYRTHPEDVENGSSLARRYRQEGRFREAANTYATLLRSFPWLPYIAAEYAWVLWLGGDREEAEEQMRAYRRKAHPGRLREATLRHWEDLKKVPEGEK